MSLILDEIHIWSDSYQPIPASVVCTKEIDKNVAMDSIAKVMLKFITQGPLVAGTSSGNSGQSRDRLIDTISSITTCSCPAER